MSFRLAEVLTPDGHLRYVVVEDGGAIVGPIAGYLRYLDDAGKARNTLRVYGLGLAHYFAYLSEKSLDYLSAGVRARAGFVGWLKRPKQGRQLQPGKPVAQARSNTTINLYLTAVSGFYDYLFRTEQISKNPNDQLAGPHRNRPYKGFLHHAAPKVVTTNVLTQAVARRTRPRTMTKDQVEQLWTACQCRRDRALVRLIFETGLRPGEALALWLEDVNIGELHIDVHDRGELVNLAEIKRPASERTLDVTQDLMNELLAYVSEAHTEAVETNHVFLVRHGPRRGQPLHYEGLYSVFRRLEKRTGLTITPYVLRHTSLTILADDGWSPERLQVRAGHKHFQTTMDHYVHPSRVQLRQAWEISRAAMTLGAPRDESVGNLRVAPTRADDPDVGGPAAGAGAWRGARVLPRADAQLLTHLARADGLTTAALQESAGRPLDGVLSSLRNLRQQGYIGWDGSQWCIQQAGCTALELARGEAPHLVLDLRTIPGVSVTVHDSRKSYHRIDLRLCPVPFRHLVSKWIEGLYGTPDKPVRSSIIKSAATWLFSLLRFYADHYPSDDDLRHLSTDVVRKWVRTALPQRQPTRDAYLDHVGRRLKVLVQFCNWVQLNEPSCLPSTLVPATLRGAGLAEVDAACEASPIQVQTPSLAPPNGSYVGQRYGNKGGVWGLAGGSASTDGRARLWLTECEHRILTVLSDGRPRARTEIATEGGLNKHTPGNLLGKLTRVGLVESLCQSPPWSPHAVSYATRLCVRASTPPTGVRGRAGRDPGRTPAR